MNHDILRARAILDEQNFTCVLCRGEQEFTFSSRGVDPLLSLLDSQHDLCGFSAADRVVGRAAAYLYVLLGVTALYAKILSRPAKEVLDRYGISVEYDTLTDFIRNRAGDGFCPMEQAVWSIDTPDEALCAIRQTKAALTKKKEASKMTENYHTHTYRCHHATGTDRQYIQTAIEGGIKRMGFSDHSPFREPNDHEQSYRISLPDIPYYLDSIRTLREELREQIELFIGYEMEYHPVYFEQMLQTALDSGAEYLILGQHLIRYGIPDVKPTTSVKPTENEADLVCYVDTVIEGMRIGVFSYVAHPDILNFIGDKEIYIREMRRLCQAAKETDTPLEINFLGLREKRNYPNEIFWKIVGEEGCEVVFGCDAHSPKHASDTQSLDKALSMVECFHLNYNPHPMLVDPKTKKKFRHLSDLDEKSTENT